MTFNKQPILIDFWVDFFFDNVELKIKSLQETITKFESKWELSFEEFKKKINDKTLKKDTYSFHVEQDFWLWEEAETLKKHYGSVKMEWI